jgi:hypothetical protein
VTIDEPEFLDVVEEDFHDAGPQRLPPLLAGKGEG